MSGPYKKFENEPPAPGEEGAPPVYSAMDPNSQQFVHQQPGQPADVQTPVSNQPPPAYTPPTIQPTQPHDEPESAAISEQPIIIAQITRHIIVRPTRGSGRDCPNCRVGTLEDQCNPAMVCIAILFFPLGLLFLLCAVDKKCNNCGHIV